MTPVSRTAPIKTVPVLPNKSPVIRVSLGSSADARSLKLSVDGRCTLMSGGTESTVLRLPKSGIRLSSRGLNIEHTSRWYRQAVSIYPKQDGTLWFNGRYYHGRLSLHLEPDGKVTAINHVDLEDYLQGVLGAEVFLSWPQAAIQAQAVAARSYALHQMLKRKDQHIHLGSDSTDQNYLGLERETARARQIIAQTRGVVLLAGRGILLTYYHSTCGGHTADVAKVFEQRTITPLSGVVCGYCADSRFHHWDVAFEKGDVTRAFLQNGISVGSFLELKLHGNGSSGRIKTVALDHSSGTASVPAADFRRIMGYDRLRSTWFDVKENGRQIHISGHGWGHGVGLCQWGSRGMAMRGYTAELILGHYYPGAKLAKLY